MFIKMKKKIVRYLCRKGWFRIARKISPEYVAEWKVEQIAHRMCESVARCTAALKELGAKDRNYNTGENKRRIKRKEDGKPPFFCVVTQLNYV